MKCSVKNCKRVYDGKGCECSFFHFPSDAATRNKWILFSGQKKECITKHSYICMHHFRSKDFANNMQYKLGFAKLHQLKQGAVPSFNTASLGNLKLYKKRAERIKKRQQKKIVESLLKEHNPIKEHVGVVDTLQELEVPFEALAYLEYNPVIESAEDVDAPSELDVPSAEPEYLNEYLEEIQKDSISPKPETSDDSNNKLKSELERLGMENKMLRKENRMTASKLRKMEKLLDKVRSIHECDVENIKK